MKRYDMEWDGVESWAMDLSESGNFVLYNDVQPITEDLNKALADNLLLVAALMAISLLEPPCSEMAQRALDAVQ